MNELTAFVQSFGLKRLGAIIGASAGVAIVLGVIVVRLGGSDYGVLYADLSYADGQKVIAQLEQQGVDYQLRERNGGLSVLAPRTALSRLKVDLAANGVVVNQTIGYEIFDRTDSFGATSFQQNMNRLRALEGELARTISSIDGVRSARVHLVLPERELFERDKKQATASIVVDAPSGVSPRSVKAIINMAASAVPALSPQNITVMDASGALLASAQSGDELGLTGGVDEKTTATEARLRRTVEDIVGRIVGPENLRVQVAAELDLKRVTENAEIIDPDSQTVLSSTLIEEAADASDPSTGRGVSVANALPGGAVVDPAIAGNARSTNRRTEEVTNYEISRTVRSEVREQGGLKRLSIAVALNAGASPRSAEAIASIAALVRSAVGFDAARGDQIEVIEMPFSALASTTTAPGTTIASSPSALNASRLAELGALALIGIALVVFVLRPLTAPNQAVTSGAGYSSGVQSVQLAAGETPALPAPIDNEFERRIDLAQVEGQVKASSLKKVAEVVKTNADESAGILKSWIREAS